VINADGSVACETDDGGGSSHDHLGQIWTGSDNPLTITGSFSTSGAEAPLILENPSYYGLIVDASEGIAVHSSGLTGFLVDGPPLIGAEIQGMHAGMDLSSGRVGIYLDAGWDGITINAEQDGISIGAGYNGVDILSAAYDGVHVATAGTVSTTYSSDSNDGIEVDGAEGYGLFVGNAGYDGIRVHEATDDALQVGDGATYPNYGLYAPNTAYTALLVYTADPNHQWALSTSDYIYAGNITTNSLSLVARVDGQDVLQPGDLVAASGLATDLPEGLAPMPLVHRADGTAFNGVIGVVTSRMEYQLAPGKETDGVYLLHSVEGEARSGDFVEMTIYGIAQVKVDATPGGILPGQRLAAADNPGHARPLRSTSVEGLTVFEGAPVVGIALAPLETGTGLIPVLVTLR
jgi:hypothetical protein